MFSFVLPYQNINGNLRTDFALDDTCKFFNQQAFYIKIQAAFKNINYDRNTVCIVWFSPLKHFSASYSWMYVHAVLRTKSLLDKPPIFNAMVVSSATIAFFT